MRMRGSWQYLLNLVLFGIFSDIALHQLLLQAFHSGGSLTAWYAGSFSSLPAPALPAWYGVYLDYSWITAAQWSRLSVMDWAFMAQTLLMIAFVLLRRPHAAIDRNFIHQLVALIAFCSGVFFIGEATTTHSILYTLSAGVIIAANGLAIASLWSLGRSFGILIARRRIKTSGVYRLVRHPMYASDILLRLGYLLTHFTWLTCVLFVLSTAAYLWRACLEEQFLSGDAEYRAYRLRVRYRLVPCIW